MLFRSQRDQLEDWAPTHVTVPSGFDRPIDYSDPETPVLAVRLQELFGRTETPRIAGIGAVTLAGVGPAGAALILACGFIGMTVDSVLGATVEGTVVGNQGVNALATLAAALTGAGAALAVSLV